MDDSFQYIKDKGINTEAIYPYKAYEQSCRKTTGPYKIKGYISKYDCAGLAAAILVRPVAVAIDASSYWDYYSSGILNKCSTTINHAVLLVGVTSTFWKIKNSWGTGWGEKGYIRLSAPNNTCGICKYPSYPTV
jgi:C1A family cysteine protease